MCQTQLHGDLYFATPCLPVSVKVFKAEDVQNSDRGSKSGSILRLVDGGVDLGHDPHKHAAINPLDQRIAHVQSVFSRHGRRHRLTARHYRLGCQCLGERGFLDL